MAAPQVGIMRRSRYVKGKKVGKGPLVEAVRGMHKLNRHTTYPHHSLLEQPPCAGHPGQEGPAHRLHRAAGHLCAPELSNADLSMRPSPTNMLTACACQAPHAGEIANFLVDDGKSVEYKQELVEMYPFFGGHIIGDKKHA